MGTNAAGLLNKTDSLIDNINYFKPQVIMLQETKVQRKNQVNLPGYQTFESIRHKNKGGGGLLTAIKEEYSPVLVSEAEDDIELLVVEAQVARKNIRFFNGYGFQENKPEEIRNKFFSKLEEEVQLAKLTDNLICIEMDGNSKFGPDIIKGDPHQMTKNGKLLKQVIERQGLILVNSTDKCKGTITRFRKTRLKKAFWIFS